MVKPIDKNIKDIITEAVNAGLQAGRMQAASTAADAFKATERRLYAIPVLIRKVKKDNEKLEELRSNGLRERSKSIVRFQRSGYRVDPEEMLEAIIRDLEATIATDEHEIETVLHALEAFKDDPFYIWLQHLKKTAAFNTLERISVWSGIRAAETTRAQQANKHMEERMTNLRIVGGGADE